MVINLTNEKDIIVICEINEESLDKKSKILSKNNNIKQYKISSLEDNKNITEELLNRNLTDKINIVEMDVYTFLSLNIDFLKRDKNIIISKIILVFEQIENLCKILEQSLKIRCNMHQVEIYQDSKINDVINKAKRHNITYEITVNELANQN